MIWQFTKLFKFVWVFRRFLLLSVSFGVAMLDVLLQSQTAYAESGLYGVIRLFALRLFGVEFRIYELMQVFLETPKLFGLYEATLVISYAVLLFYVVRFIKKILEMVIGQGASDAGYYLAAISFLAILEVVAILVLEQKGYIPFSGVWLLLTNFRPVFDHFWTGVGFETSWSDFVNATVDEDVRKRVLSKKLNNSV